MNKFTGILICILALTCFVGCQRSPLKERVIVTDGISVMMPSDFKKNDMGDGNVLIRSKVGTTDLRVVAIKDTSINGLSPEKLKEGLEVNVNEFLKPMQGKLIHRKDTITGKLVISDFEFELGSTGAVRHGVGKFILKENKFIAFLIVSSTTDPKSEPSLQEKFFNSIKMD